MILHIYTILHVILSLIAIFTGFIVLFGILNRDRLDRWTKWFLVTAVATTLTGFFFPFEGFTPAFKLGIISTIVLAITIFARYSKHLAGAWCRTYVVGALLSLYFNVFVAIVQAFQKLPALKAIAPTQTEPPFAITQVVVLALFALIIIIAAIRFRPQPVAVA